MAPSPPSIIQGVSICPQAYPHIFGAILDHAPYRSLLALRAASRDMRDYIDTLFVAHVVVFNDIATSFPSERRYSGYNCPLPDDAELRKDDKLVYTIGGGGRLRHIPREGWLDVPLLADAVRVVDIAECQDYACLRLKADDSWREAGADPDLALSVIVKRTARRWCNQEQSSVARLNARMAAKLHRVQLIRQWGDHQCIQAIAAPRTVSFMPPLLLEYTGTYGSGYPVETPTHVVYSMDLQVPRTSYSTNTVIRRALEWDKSSWPVSEAKWNDSLALWKERFHTFAPLPGFVAQAVDNGYTCTLVDIDSWPLGHFADSAEFRSQLEHVINHGMSWYPSWEEQDARDRIARCLVYLTEAEYRASIGDEMYALESYCGPLVRPQALAPSPGVM